MGACKECGCKDGDRGPMGDQGLQGATGDQGAQGAPGPIGPQGIQGLDGIQGPQGLQGAQGPSGTNITGPAGPTGPQGIQGIQGIQGNDGNDGLNGADGANGQGQITWSIDASAVPTVLSPVGNSGLILKNTAFVDIELPLGALLGDVISIAGTIAGTGGWKLVALGTDTIQMTSQSALNYETNPGGEVQLGVNNYHDVIHLIADGTGKWIITDVIFAGGVIPLFT